MWKRTSELALTFAGSDPSDDDAAAFCKSDEERDPCGMSLFARMSTMGSIDWTGPPLPPKIQ
jgi:hypothetical protein